MKTTVQLEIDGMTLAAVQTALNISVLQFQAAAANIASQAQAQIELVVPTPPAEGATGSGEPSLEDKLDVGLRGE